MSNRTRGRPQMAQYRKLFRKGGWRYFGRTKPMVSNIPPTSRDLILAEQSRRGDLTCSGDAAALANLEIDVEKQVNHAVFGIAGDVSLGKFHGDSTWSETSPGEEATSPWTSDTGLLASLRARAGISFGAFLPYVTGGLAYQSTDVVWNYELNPPNLPDLPTSNTHLNSLGWVIGAGLQVALSQGWSLQGEYDFSSFGNVTDPNIPFDDEGPVLGGTINNNISVVKFSLKHKFGP
jgi:opacity protein-like surface antigen